MSAAPYINFNNSTNNHDIVKRVIIIIMIIPLMIVITIVRRIRSDNTKVMKTVHQFDQPASLQARPFHDNPLGCSSDAFTPGVPVRRRLATPKMWCKGFPPSVSSKFRFRNYSDLPRLWPTFDLRSHLRHDYLLVPLQHYRRWDFAGLGGSIYVMCPPGNQHIPCQGMFEDDFLFPRLDMLVPWRDQRSPTQFLWRVGYSRPSSIDATTGVLNQHS